VSKRENYHLDFLHHHLPSDEGRRLYAYEAAMMAVSNALVAALEAAGKNRSWLADALGRTPGFVSQVLSGSRNMTLKTLAEFAFALGLEVGDLSLAPLGESLISHDAMDKWLDEESIVAEGRADVVATTGYESTESIIIKGREATFVG
jgi:transcriptional regulator with XRE-family HTH domain